MTTFDDMLKEFPDETRRQLEGVWEKLPPAARKEAESLVQALPGNPLLWRMLLDQVLRHYKVAAGGKRAIAIVGPANVGKSTLYNQLIRSKEDRAEVGPIPGTTRLSQNADSGLFEVIDTPGADAVGEVGEAEKEHALASARAADVLLIVFDASQGIKRAEKSLFDELTALGKSQIVVLNKIDLVLREIDKVVGRAAANLRLEREQVIPFSARDGRFMDRLLGAIVKTEPEIVAALGRGLPHYRWQLAWGSITSAATTSAAIALTPLPILDFFPLMAVQASLVLGIARIYNYEITFERARELVATFGLGMLGRTLFQQLSKLGGPPGWLLSAAIAASTTAVMGYASAIWFEKGERLTADSIRQVTGTLTTYLLDSLRGLGKRPPSQESLKERLAEVLENAPMAHDRDAVEHPPGPADEPPGKPEGD